MTRDCLFCKIAGKEIKSDIVYETPELVAFNDIKPQAPVHVLIIPRKHIDTISDIKGEDVDLAGKMVQAANKIARDNRIDQSGYRLVMNCRKDAGQVVFHIHLHLLGGRTMNWPPG